MNVRATLQRVLDRYATAYRAADSEGCAACFTEDAHLLSPYAPPARGRAAIAALHETWVEGGEDKTLVLREGGIEGALGWGLADYAGGEATDRGSTLCVFHRQPDGDWLIGACSLNAADTEA